MDKPNSEVIRTAAQSERERTPLRARSKVWFILAAAIALIAWAGSWVHHRWTHIYVDDARIEGEVVTLASRVSGWITDLNVIEGDEVKKGQVVARVDERESVLQKEVLLARVKTIEGQMAVIRAQMGQVSVETSGKVQTENNRLSAAEAEVALQETNLKQAKLDYERTAKIHAKQYVSDQEMERARTAYQQAEDNRRRAIAEVAAARGNVAIAGGSRKQLDVLTQQLVVLASQAAEIRAEVQRQEVDIDSRTIVSPGDGRIVMAFVRKGEHVAAGQRIAMFHDPRQIWVEANVKETAVGMLKPGMRADIRVDAYPGRVVHGEIQAIGQAATSKFALLPDPNPSGNFTKITQRLPVRIRLTDKDVTLRPGMMVEVDIPVGNN